MRRPSDEHGGLTDGAVQYLNERLDGPRRDDAFCNSLLEPRAQVRQAETILDFPVALPTEDGRPVDQDDALNHGIENGFEERTAAFVETRARIALARVCGHADIGELSLLLHEDRFEQLLLAGEVMIE